MHSALGKRARPTPKFEIRRPKTLWAKTDDVNMKSSAKHSNTTSLRRSNVTYRIIVRTTRLGARICKSSDGSKVRSRAKYSGSKYRQPIAAERDCGPLSGPGMECRSCDRAGWNALVNNLGAQTATSTRELEKHLSVTREDVVINGVKAFLLTPPVVSPENRNRLLINTHGGGYLYNPGEAGTMESVSMAAYGGIKIVSVDYRMPPDHPYPAGLDDCMKVWRATAETNDPKKLGLFGSSAGAGMALAMILRAKDEGLPLPAALAIGTPWADLTETGDTFKTNEWLDNVLVSYNGYLSRAARLYANGRDLKDPYLSPIYGDFSHFPPTVLASGTRDLLLSLTVLTHRKLRRATVEAELHVFEGMSHINYVLNPLAPESRELFTEWAKFFDKHLDR
jgi:epsilon-lactone hydrolase